MRVRRGAAVAAAAACALAAGVVTADAAPKPKSLGSLSIWAHPPKGWHAREKLLTFHGAYSDGGVICRSLPFAPKGSTTVFAKVLATQSGVQVLGDETLARAPSAAAAAAAYTGYVKAAKACGTYKKTTVRVTGAPFGGATIEQTDKGGQTYRELVVRRGSYLIAVNGYRKVGYYPGLTQAQATTLVRAAVTALAH